jgi:TPR repeat protein
MLSVYERAQIAYARKDFVACRELLEQVPDEGRAWMLLGQLASEGSGQPEDPTLAARHYLRGAELGDATAAYCLGALHALGRGVGQDYPAALSWYERAGDLGLPAGYRQVGMMHATGQGVPADLAAAQPWWLKAAAQGDADAMGDLGKLYAYHRDDPIQAAQWYLRACEHGYQDMAAHDVAKTIHGLTPLAEAGHARALTMLAVIRMLLLKDDAGAIAALTPAAEQGDTEAQRTLGFLLQRTSPDGAMPARAVTLFRLAAEAGDGYAAYNLGVAYEKGEGGLEADDDQAAQWFQIAADRGCVQAYACLGDRLGKLERGAEALAWYVKGAQAGHAGCMNAAACWYRDGYGTEVDLLQSLRWFLAMMRSGNYNGLHPAHQIAERMTDEEIFEAGVLAEAPDLAVILVKTRRQAGGASAMEGTSAGG